MSKAHTAGMASSEASQACGPGAPWSPLEAYKRWVRAHPDIVNNLDLCLYPIMFNPSRTSSQRWELLYEAAHTAVGLISVANQHIIDSEHAVVRRPAAALWLEAVEQFTTLIEIRGMHLEQHGKMSRYGPLATLETIKAVLKMAIWTQYPGHLFLRHPDPEDIDQFESEQGLSDVVAAMERLRRRYSRWDTPRGVLQQLQTWLCPSGSSAPTTARPGPRSKAEQQQKQQQGWTWGVLPVRKGKGKGSAQGGETVQADVTATVHGPDKPGTSGSGSGPTTKVSGSAGGCHRGEGPVSLLQCMWSNASGGGTSAESEAQRARMGADLVWLGEVLHIWRPVVYACMLHRYGRTSWRPWFTALGVELLSMYFTHRGKALLREASGTEPPPRRRGSRGKGSGGDPGGDGLPGNMVNDWAGPMSMGVGAGGRETSLLSLAMARGLLRQPWSVGERRELSDRRWSLLWYLLRSPALDMGVRPLVDGLRSRTSKVPVIGFATEYLADLVDTYTQYYSYTARSH